MFDVIVVGAGVVGPAIATAMARQGRKVLIVERDWTKPDRIVGELMQPAGIQALRELGGGILYQVFGQRDSFGLPYKTRRDVSKTRYSCS